MNQDRWKQIDELFDAVLDLPENQREAFLNEKCQNDAELKNEVLSLLNAQTGSDNFLENSAMGIAARNLADEKTINVESYLIGKIIGTYKIESLLGSGGMGEVYLAHDEKLRRKVALKILPAEYTTNDERVKRFQLEARAISALNHPNIVTIYDVGSFENINYIATEYVEGKTLRELIGSRLKVREVLAIIIQCCEALSAAHSRGIIHRDIKPENIIVRPDGYIKILDFGLAKLSEIDFKTMKDFSQTAKGVIIGTPAYMSPEQVADEKVDHRTDLWSIGVVLYEMLTESNPFKKENRQAIFQAILSEEPPLASSLNAGIPLELDQILIKALEKDADLSYQTASDLRADLKRIKRELDSSPSMRSSSSGYLRERSSKTSRLIWGLSFLIFFIGIAGFIFYKYFYGVPYAPDWTKAQNIPLTTQAGTEFFPSLAPDGKSFVFTAQINGKSSILRQRVGGKIADNLTESSSADDSQPVFSPDGEFIAFRSERQPKGIYIMGASGENPRRISDFGFHPSWSPDGKQIAVSTNFQELPVNKNPSAIWIINIESEEKRLLIDNFAMQPSWSPDFRFIAFWFTESGGSRNVAVVSIEGGEPIVLRHESTTNWNPVWSPDGNFLYFISDRSGSMAVWRVRFDVNYRKFLGEPEIVPTPATYNRHLSFSADGKRLIYVQTNNQVNLKAAEFDQNKEKLTSEPYWVTNGNHEIYLHELSPDGTTFVMRNISPTQEDIVLVNRDGTNFRELTVDKFFDRYARWSPDGKTIIFTSDRKGKYDIWTIAPDGTNLKQITFENEKAASIPAWSPDGKFISFDNNTDSFILDLSKRWGTESLQQIPKLSKEAFFRVWDWSPDGKKLLGYFNKGEEKGMAVYFLETQKFEQINDKIAFNFWFPDNRRIIYSFDGKPYITDTVTKKTREISDIKENYVRHIRLSRDGKLVSYTVMDSESDIWLLDLTAK